LIAFIKHDEPPRSAPAVQRARRLVASTLLRRRQSKDDSPGVPAWLAWTFTAWLVGVTLVYGLSMLGWFSM
jgi:hypothetical protein